MHRMIQNKAKEELITNIRNSAESRLKAVIQGASSEGGHGH